MQYSMSVYTLGTLSGDSDYMHSGGYCMTSYDFQYTVYIAGKFDAIYI